MPREKEYIRSGSTLDPKYIQYAKHIAERLKLRANTNSLLSYRTVDSKRIIEHFKAQLKVNVSGSDIRAMVNYLRREGYPICASNDGYFWSNDINELSESVDALTDRITSMTAARDGLRRALRALIQSKSQQLSL